MRISATTLESFRLFMEPEQEWMTEQMLADTILGKFVPTGPVLIGSAFGKVLETPDDYAVAFKGYTCKGYTFDALEMRPALALMDHKLGVFEAKASRRYGDCDVVAVADQIVGTHLIEHKTTLGYFDFAKYADSYQWRFMADIFEPSKVTYHVFLLDDHENGVVGLRGIESFSLYPYLGLHDDCQALLDQFVTYVTAKGLDGYLRQRQVEAA